MVVVDLFDSPRICGDGGLCGDDRRDCGPEAQRALPCGLSCPRLLCSPLANQRFQGISFKEALESDPFALESGAFCNGIAIRLPRDISCRKQTPSPLRNLLRSPVHGGGGCRKRTPSPLRHLLRSPVHQGPAPDALDVEPPAAPQPKRRLPLEKAIIQGDLAAARVALMEDPEVVGDFDSAPLCLVAQMRCAPGMCKLLLEFRADCQAIDAQGRTPLGVLALSSGQDNALPLASKEMGIAYPPPPVHIIGSALASKTNGTLVRERLICASELLACGADPAAADALGATPVHLASKFGHPQLARLYANYRNVQAVAVFRRAAGSASCSDNNVLAGNPGLVELIGAFLLERGILERVRREFGEKA